MREACTADLIDIINNNRLTVYFQPIVSVVKKSVIGLEALSRGIADREGGLVSPVELFNAAAEAGLSTGLDRQCRKNSITAYRGIYERFPDILLFLNIDAATIEKNIGSRHLLDTVESLRVPPKSVVIEINEAKVTDLNCLESFITFYRQHGFLIALDDVGAGFSNLDRLTCTRPDIIKIDRSLVSGIDRNPSMQEVFRSLAGLSGKIGALTIAEGVETESEAVVLMELGADMLQGYYFGRPESYSEDRVTATRSMLQKSADRYRKHMTDRLFEEKFEYLSYSDIADDFIAELSQIPGDRAEAKLSELICRFEQVECIYLLDSSGRQVSGTVCGANVKYRHNAIFQPAIYGDDHSLKKYYYSLIGGNPERHITDSYISLATGNRCRTISTRYADSAGSSFILCIDISKNC